MRRVKWNVIWGTSVVYETREGGERFRSLLSMLTMHGSIFHTLEENISITPVFISNFDHFRLLLSLNSGEKKKKPWPMFCEASFTDQCSHSAAEIEGWLATCLGGYMSASRCNLDWSSASASDPGCHSPDRQADSNSQTSMLMSPEDLSEPIMSALLLTGGRILTWE